MSIYYTESHEWIKVEDDIATIGITDYAQNELGDIVYVELPAEGDEIETDDPFGTIEAVKAVEDIIAPISGEVIAVNEILEDTPELINKSAQEDGWIIKVKIKDKEEFKNLLDESSYKKMIAD